MIRLRRFGYTLAEALEFTPRQIVALIREHELDRRREMAEMLSVYATGSRGDKDQLKKLHKELIGGV